MVVMYSRTCPHQTVNEARQVLFAQGNKSIENIPPTQAALAQHIKRAAYQAGHAWGQALEPMQELPSPAKWGWQQSPEGWSPKWTTLAEASRACSELISCGCKKACRGLCKCTKASLPCTALCTCSCAGSCYQLCNNNLDRTKFYNGFTFFRTWVPCGFPYKPYIGICKAVYC